MPLDILQQLEEQANSLDDAELFLGFDSLKEKVSQSSEAMSVLKSIVDAVSSSHDNLHGKLTRIIKDFEIYDRTIQQARGENYAFSESLKRLGEDGCCGIRSINNGLTENLSLLRTVQREVEKYNQLLNKNVSVPLISRQPIQSFNNGGRIRGNQKHGDKILARVNADEWVLTERQMHNLARMTYSSSPSEVFRKAGGAPGKIKRDSMGLPMFSSGGRVSLKQENISRKAAEAKKILQDLYSNEKNDKERNELEDQAELIDRILDEVKKLDNDDFHQKPQFEKSIVSKLDFIIKNKNRFSNTNSFSATLRGISGHNSKKELIKTQEKLAEQEKEFNASWKAPVDLSQVKGKKAKQYADWYNQVSNEYADPTINAGDRPEILKTKNAVKTMFDISSRTDFDAKEKKQRQKFQKQFESADTAEELEKVAEAAKEWARQIDLARDTISVKDFSHLSEEAKAFAESLEHANKVVESKYSNEEEKAIAKREGAASKSMLDLTQLKYLTRSQKRQRADIISRYNSASTLEEKEKIAAESQTGELSLNEVERSIGAADTALLNFNKDTDELLEKWKTFLGGTPTGILAVGVAIGFAGKQLGDFMNRISDSVENLAKLSIEAHHAKSNLDSMFGEGTFDSFREEMNLTLKEMNMLAPAIQDAYRKAGVEMEHIAAAAENIKNSFGALDPRKLQEALSVMEELTEGQQKFLLTESGSTSDMENMYANLMASGKSGVAADLMEQGVFGGDATAGLNEGDKAIVEALQTMNVLGEDISMALKDGFGGVLPPLLQFGKTLAVLAPIAASTYQMFVTSKAALKLASKNGLTVQRISQLVKPPILVTNLGGVPKTLTTPRKPNAPSIPGSAKPGSLTSRKGIGIGSTVKGAAAAIVAELVVAGITEGIGYFADKAAKREEIKEKKEKLKVEKDYQTTGYVTGNTSLELDREKAQAAGLKDAKTGAWIGGTLAGLGTGIITGVGALGTAGMGTPAAIALTAGAAAAGASAGATAGYTHGYNAEIAKQLGDTINNPLLWKSGSKKPSSFQQGIDNFRSTGLGKVAMFAANPALGFANLFTQPDHIEDMNMELVDLVTETSSYVAKIQKNQEKNRKEMVASLRFQEGIERTLKKIDSGAFSRFDDLNVEGGKAANQLITTMGGADASYGANITKILDSTTNSFKKNTEQINFQREKLFKQEGISYAARINASNELVKQQAKVTQKWLNEILASIGEYDKIPTVIQNSLKKKISEINLSSAGKGLGMTSGMMFMEAQAAAAQGVHSAGAVTGRFLKESAQVEEKMQSAQEEGKKVYSRYKETQQSRNGVSWLRNDVIDSNGKVNEDALSDNQRRIQSKRNEVDLLVRQKTGLQEGSYLQTMESYEDLKSHQKKFRQISKDVEGMSEKDFEAQRFQLLKKIKEQLNSALDSSKQALNSDIDPILKESVEKSIPAIEDRIARLTEMEGKDFDQDQFKKMLPFDSMLTGNATAKIDALKAEAESDPAVKTARDEIGRAQVLNNEISAAYDSQTAAFQAQLKMIEGFQKQVEEIRSASMMFVNAVDQDPSAVFWRMAKSSIEAAQDSMMETGKFGDYAASTIQNASNEMTALKEAVKKGEAKLADHRETLKSKVTQTLSEAKNPEEREKMQQMLGLTEQLSDARLQYAKNQSPENAALVKMFEKAIDQFLETNFSGKENEAARTKMEALLSMQTAYDQSAIELIKKGNEAQSKSLQLFHQMISLMDGYKNQLDYLKTISREKESNAGLTLARKQLNGDAASAYAEMGIANAKEQYDIAIKGLNDTYSAGMADLDKRLAEASTPEEADALRKEMETLTSERNARTMEEQARLDDQIVKYAQLEYEAKKRTAELSLEALELQSNFLQTIGAPMEAIVAVERQRVGYAQEQAAAAKEQYDRVLSSGASEEEINKARNEWMRKDLEAIQAQYGTQRSMMEKVFGNMIGSFSETAGILGPGNLASKYGFGYYENKDGTVMRGGKSTGGYRDRVFGNNAFTLGSASNTPMHSGDVPGSSQTVPSNKSGKSSTDRGQAGNSTTGNNEWSTLGEEFQSEVKALEAVVFWQKKIYNLLNDTFVVSSPAVDQEVKTSAKDTLSRISNNSPKMSTETTAIVPGNAEQLIVPSDPRNRSKKSKTITPTTKAEIPLLNAEGNAISKEDFVKHQVEKAEVEKFIKSISPEEVIFNRIFKLPFQDIEKGLQIGPRKGLVPIPTEDKPQSLTPAPPEKKEGLMPVPPEKQGFFGSTWAGIKNAFSNPFSPFEGFSNGYAAASEGVALNELENYNATPPTPLASPASKQEETATPVKVAVEVQVKFNNQMFEEAVKRIVTSSGIAKQIAREGMESQNA